MYIDEKQTIWQRHHYRVTADTQEEANELLKNELNYMSLSDKAPVRFNESEFLFDTQEYMTVRENDGVPTREACWNAV